LKVLVTGANGFLGRRLVETLVSSGDRDVRVFVRPGRALDGLDELEAAYPGTSLDVCRGDLTVREDAFRAVRDVDTVYHAAAAMGGGAANLIQNTVVGSRNLLDAVVAMSKPARVVLVSSFGVYGTANLPAGALVDESTPLETRPELRDPYSFSKLRQERLFWDYRKTREFSLIVTRPGVIYGPGGTALTTRIGIEVFGTLFHFGRNNTLPLTYVDNCADAIVTAGRIEGPDDDVFNVVDDDLPTSREFLRAYRKNVARKRYLTVPYPMTMMLSRFVAWYHRHSKGQLPPILTPYKTASHWKGNTFSNAKLKGIGWRPLVPTSEAIDRYCKYWRAAISSAGSS
jgi:nucleoside-diphosphate-sugar epimerase